MPLSDLLREAVARLQAESFVSRIDEQLQGKVVQ